METSVPHQEGRTPKTLGSPAQGFSSLAIEEGGLGLASCPRNLGTLAALVTSRDGRSA